MTTQGGPNVLRSCAAVHRATVACLVVLATGCQTMTGPTAPLPPPTQLLDAARLQLPATCTVPTGQPYRMSYVVGTDGRTGGLGTVTPPDAPACLRDALKAWVASFRYAPIAQAEPVTADWMLVSARRGS
jgi:hypothetical protein